MNKLWMAVLLTSFAVSGAASAFAADDGHGGDHHGQASSRFSRLHEGVYGTDSNYCGERLELDQHNLTIYMEAVSNPLTGLTCTAQGQIDVAVCESADAQHCVVNSDSTSYLKVMPDGDFLWFGPGSLPTNEYRWATR